LSGVVVSAAKERPMILQASAKDDDFLVRGGLVLLRKDFQARYRQRATRHPQGLGLPHPQFQVPPEH